MVFNTQHVVSPRRELMAYEVLFGMHGQSLKSLDRLFRESGTDVPSEALDKAGASDLFENGDLHEKVEHHLAGVSGFSVLLKGSFQFPERLFDAEYPARLLYYRGDISLLETRCVSIVGSRKASKQGLTRAATLAKGLAEEDITVVSGLAAGIDTAAMTTAIEAGGRTLGVIGTPINKSYPAENRELQERVATDHLLISQVPFYRYEVEPFRAKRRYFPERNVTMASLSEATVIVEASDTSGTHTQARSCLQLGRKLLITESCFENPAITWPAKYEREGAIRVRTLQDVLDALSDE